jgi:hypothetical protein
MSASSTLTRRSLAPPHQRDRAVLAYGDVLVAYLGGDLHVLARPGRGDVVVCLRGQ